MFRVIHALIAKLRAKLPMDAATDLETRQQTERKAHLLRQATRYDAEGLHGIARHIRDQAEAIDARTP